MNKTKTDFSYHFRYGWNPRGFLNREPPRERPPAPPRVGTTPCQPGVPIEERGKDEPLRLRNPPKVSCWFQRFCGFADQCFKAVNDTDGHVLVTISSEMNPIAVGHFSQLIQSVTDRNVCGSRGDTA